MPASIPTKTDGSIGRVKSDAVPAADLNTDYPAAEHERIKDVVIEMAAEIGETASPAPGSILARLDEAEAATGLPLGTHTTGRDHFTEGLGAWVVDTQNGGDISQGSNGAPYGVPGVGAVALNISTTADSRATMFRAQTGLCLDTTIPLVVDFRVNILDSGVPSDTDCEWWAGVSIDPDRENVVALVALWDSGTSTRSYALVVLVVGVPDIIPVTLPALGAGESWHLQVRGTPTGATVWAAKDTADLALVGTSATAPASGVYLPFLHLAKESGAGGRSLVCDWVGWDAASAPDITPTPTGGEFQGYSPPGDVTGPSSSTDNRLARFDGVTGKAIQDSAITVDDSGNVSGVGTLATGNQTVTGNITVSGTVDGRDVSADGSKLDTVATGADDTATSLQSALDSVYAGQFGDLHANGVGVQIRRMALTAAQPTTGDDSSQGYTFGSVWIDQSTSPNDVYMCVDPSVGAAVWLLLTPNAATVVSGTYTPTLTPSDGAITVTVLDSFRYTRVGNTVWVEGMVEMETAGGSPPDNVEITLPIACGSSTAYFASGSYECQDSEVLRGPIWGEVDGLSANVFMQLVGTSAAGPFNVNVRFSYRTDS